MHVLNKSGRIVLVSDIDLVIPHDPTQNKCIYIPETAKDSMEFQSLINNGTLVETTAPIKEEVVIEESEEPEEPAVEETDEEKWKKEFFVEEDSSKHRDPFFKPENKKSKFIHRPNPVIARPSYNAVEKYKSEGVMDVEWCGPATDYGGYALMNRRCIFGLNKRKDINLKYELMPSLNDLDDGTYNSLVEMENRITGSQCVKVFGMTAPQAAYGDSYKIFYTMMETYGVHQQYADRCALCNELWLPTQFCIDQFKESGVKTPMTKMPLGIDPDTFNPDNVQEIEFTNQCKNFVFLSVFGWSYRKGYDILLKSFCEEFTSKDDVTLLISSRYYGSTEDEKKDRIRNDTKQAIAGCQNKDHPHIVLFGDLMPEQLMPSMYASADAFVLPSRGEGFGLPFLEAAAMGLPVIGSNVTGQTEFLREDNAFIVEAESMFEADSRMTWISHFYEGMKFPEFGPNTIEKVRKHMRLVYEKDKSVEKKTKKLQQLALNEYTWDNTVERAYQRIKEIYERAAQ